MTETEEQAYVQGSQQAWLTMLHECLRHLGETERNAHGWMLERQEALQQLRSLCREFGDNEWPDDLYLPDIIDKHLGDHLRAKK